MPEQTNIDIRPIQRVENLGSRILQRFETVRRKFDKPPSEEKKIDNFERYICTGLEAIRKRDYQGATKIFSQPGAAEKVGLMYTPGTVVFLTDTPKSKAEVDAIVHDVANNSWFNPPSEHGRGKIKIAQVEIAPLEATVDHRPIPQSPELNAIFHDVALLNAEEWIHALRFKKGIDIHSDSLTSASDLDEAQVALYLLQHNVPLTERFLTQYSRRNQLRALGYQV
jgi:hypothetical protein